MENQDVLNGFFEARKQILGYYSPYSFLRNIDDEKLFINSVKDPIIGKVNSDLTDVIIIKIENQPYYFMVEHLLWDTKYFGFPIYKLHAILFDQSNLKRLTMAVLSFIDKFIFKEGNYCFTDIPSEDTLVLQALTSAGFKLIETRLTYFIDLNYHNYSRFGVRSANINDIPNLRIVASEMRNPYDRFHADPVFNFKKADEFLATFIEESVKGFADYTMVPDEIGVPPDAFLTAKYLKNVWPKIGANVSMMVLSAVSSKTCRGWYKKLISEMAFHLRDIGADYAFMHPASTNKAVIHSYETLGCKLGQTTHVLSCFKQI